MASRKSGQVCYPTLSRVKMQFQASRKNDRDPRTRVRGRSEPYSLLTSNKNFNSIADWSTYDVKIRQE